MDSLSVLRVVMAGLAGTGGLTALGFSLLTILRSGRKQRWPHAMAKMLACEAVPDGKGPRFRMRVRYAFEAEGRTYEGTTFGLHNRTFEKKAADLLVRRYSAGSSVPARFNPANPAQCYLDSTESTWPMVLGSVSVTLLMAAFWIVVTGLRR